MTPWIYLFISVIFEIAWATSLKATEGFTRPIPSVFNFIICLLNLYILSLALKSLPIGTAYAIWVGLGAIGVTIFSVYFYQETLDMPRIVCIAVIIVGVCGLKYFTPV
ncbi:MAG: multidrug efflux SMR transporter [Bdellovibrionota bacterium]